MTTKAAKQDEQRGSTEVEKIPVMEIADNAFLLGLNESQNKVELRSKLLSAIKEYDMSHYYRSLNVSLGLSLDAQTLADMDVRNEQKLKDLDAKVLDAEKNLGETEVRDALYKKSLHLATIGDLENALLALTRTYDKTVGVGRRIDLVLFRIRLGLFHQDHKLVSRSIAQAKDLMEQGGDWDRKNRLKAYEGLYSLSIREFKKAAELFLDAVSTFTSYELMNYEQLIFYTVVSAMLSLDRNDLRAKVIQSSEVQEQLYAQNDLRVFLTSFYECNYGDFFHSLATYVLPRFRLDRFLAPHHVYYVRAIRTNAYKQLISSYSSLTLKYMADSFGVSVDFMDRELHQLVASGELSCKVDSVRGVVETNQMDARGHQYQALIKHCDVLLNRIHKLSHVINA